MARIVLVADVPSYISADCTVNQTTYCGNSVYYGLEEQMSMPSVEVVVRIGAMYETSEGLK